MATGIYWPQKLPCWLMDSHEGQDEDIYARTEVDYGPARLRRMYTRVPHIRKAKIFLYGEQPAIFHYFFENDIAVGERRFIAPFRAIGSEESYYECEFVEPYDAEFVLLSEARRAWRVSCTFRLYGDGKMTPPYTEPAILSGKMMLRLRARGKVRATSQFSGNLGVSLKGVIGFQNLGGGEISVQLHGDYHHAEEWSGAMMVALAGRIG